MSTVDERSLARLVGGEESSIVHIIRVGKAYCGDVVHVGDARHRQANIAKDVDEIVHRPAGTAVFDGNARDGAPDGIHRDCGVADLDDVVLSVPGTAGHDGWRGARGARPAQQILRARDAHGHVAGQAGHRFVHAPSRPFGTRRIVHASDRVLRGDLERGVHVADRDVVSGIKGPCSGGDQKRFGTGGGCDKRAGGGTPGLNLCYRVVARKRRDGVVGGQGHKGVSCTAVVGGDC